MHAPLPDISRSQHTKQSDLLCLLLEEGVDCRVAGRGRVVCQCLHAAVDTYSSLCAGGDFQEQTRK